MKQDTGRMFFRWNGSRWVLDKTRPRPQLPDKSPERIAARKVLTPIVRAQITIAADETCTYCERRGTFWRDPDDRPWHMDHIEPIERGGSIDIDNVALSCARCNMAKGCRNPEEWKP